MRNGRAGLENRNEQDLRIKNLLQGAILLDERKNEIHKEELNIIFDEIDKKRVKKSRLKRIAIIAAAFIIVIGATAKYTDFADEIIPKDVIAGKTEKTEVNTNNGIIGVYDEKYAEEISEEEMCLCTNWEQVETAKEVYPDLILLTKAPKDYELKELKIWPREDTYYMVFKGKDNEMEITQSERKETTLLNNLIEEKEYHGISVYRHCNQNKEIMWSFTIGEKLIFVKGAKKTEDINNIIDILKKTI